MSQDQQFEIPHLDFPYEVTPVDRPEVEITTPHPLPDEPAAASTVQTANPIGFTVE